MGYGIPDDGQGEGGGVWPPGWEVPTPLDSWCWGDLDVVLSPNPVLVVIDVAHDIKHIRDISRARPTRLVAHVEAACDPVDGLFNIKLLTPLGVSAASFRESMRVAFRAALDASKHAESDMAGDDALFDEGADSIITAETRVVFDWFDATVSLSPAIVC